MSYYSGNPRVQNARNQENYAELSRLGKKGVAAKKKKKERRMFRLLAQVKETMEQANEHICPVD